ncbi:MAG TPA: DUF3857 domain-containing protein [Saprospiraceae bacterium]|nr:DUF3857 domain-containing protein [Saprospiraceae bacterium]
MTSYIKKYFWLIAICWPVVIWSQDKPQYSVLLIDTALLKNAQAVIRFEETHYIIESPREYIQQGFTAVSIFNEDASASYISIPYDKYNKAELTNIVLYDAWGNVLRKVKKSELTDHARYSDITFLSDDRFIGFRSFGGQLPYTLEYEWKITHAQTMTYPAWRPLSNGESVEKSIFVLETPSDLVVHTKILNNAFEYVETFREGIRLQTWTLLKKGALQREASGPSAYDLFPMLLMTPSTFQVEDYSGSMTDWKSFGAFLYTLNKDKEKMPPEMIDLIHQMTAHFDTPKEKIDTLYHWLQKNMRYVSVQLGVGGWQSFDAAYVEKNRYGDCKALSTFMKGMLREIGIESFQVIIKWDEEEALFADDFMYSDFNHMMVHIPSENMWLECTSNYLPTGFIDRDEENKKVLLITPEGGKISRTPSSPDSLNRITTTDTIFTGQPVILKGRAEYRGNLQRRIRSLFYYSSQEEQRKSFLEHFHLQIQKLDHLHISSSTSGLSSAMDYNATLSQFGSASGIRYFIPVNSIQPPRNSCTGNTDRKTDFISRDDFTETNDIYISIPPGYEIEYLPAKSAFEFRGNQYAVELMVENKFIHVHHQVTESPMRLTPAEYMGLCNYYTSVAKSNGQMIVLKKSKT